MAVFRINGRRVGRVPDIAAAAIVAGFFGLIVAGCAAWVTHVVWVISKLASDAGATAGQIILGIAGTFVPPVGVVHGFMIWFGIGF